MCGCVPCNSTSTLRPTTMPTSWKATITGILHQGLGDTTHGAAEMLAGIRSSHTQCVSLPTGPVMPVTPNVNLAVTSWCDSIGFSLDENRRMGLVLKRQQKM
uniref:Phospholipase/carboxylesterase/thioesterase domain-containing protein n=1 Tax=Spermophilus dauricus TaxID=99837 RepID=A0A8C9P512_SPEDA